MENKNSENNDWREEFEKKWNEEDFFYIVNGKSPKSRIIEFIASTIQSEKDKAVKERDIQILTMICDNPTEVRDPICLSGAKIRQKEIINLIITSPTRATMGDEE